MKDKKYEIKSGVPIPTGVGTRNGVFPQLILAMKDGDCVEGVSLRDAQTIGATAHLLRVKVARRKDTHGTYTIWRVGLMGPKKGKK